MNKRLNYQIKLTVYIMILVSLNYVNTMQQEKNNQESHLKTFLKDIVVGSLTGISEVTVNQPLVGIKNALQQSQPIRPKKLYKGYCVNALSMAPITAMQVCTNSIFQRILSSGKDLSIKDKILSAFLAGAISSLVSSPSELIMIKQQNHGKNFYQTLKNLLKEKKIRSLTRGIVPTAFRDGGFSTGYLALSQIISKELEKVTDHQNKLLGGVLAGILSAIVTHPFDTIKTQMQAHDQNLTTTLRTYDQEGFKTLFKGLIPRTTRVMMAIPLMSILSNNLRNSNLLN